MIHPFIIAAQTLDGFIAKEPTEPSTSWTSGEDKKFFRERTKAAGVVIMGSKTFETIGSPLKDRLNIVYTRSGKKYQGAETTNKSPKDLLDDLEKRGFKEAAVCGGSSIYSLFLKSGLVETLYITLEPKLFGAGISLTDKKLDMNLSLVSTQQLSKDVILLEYKVKK